MMVNIINRSSRSGSLPWSETYICALRCQSTIVLLKCSIRIISSLRRLCRPSSFFLTVTNLHTSFYHLSQFPRHILHQRITFPVFCSQAGGYAVGSNPQSHSPSQMRRHLSLEQDRQGTVICVTDQRSIVRPLLERLDCASRGQIMA